MNSSEKEGSSLPHMSAIIEEDISHGHNATSAFIADLIGNVTDIDLRSQLRRLDVSDSVDCQQLFGGRVLSEYSSSSSKQQLFDQNDESGLEIHPYTERIPQSKYYEKFLQGEDLTDTSTSSAFLGKPADESYSRTQGNRKTQSNQKIHLEQSSRQEPSDKNNERLMDGYMRLKKQIEELAQQVQGGQDKRHKSKDTEEHDNSSSSKNKLVGSSGKQENKKRKRTNSSINREIISKQLLEELQSRHATEIQQLRGQMLKLIEEKSGLEMRYQESQRKVTELTDELQKKSEETKQENLRVLRESEEKLNEKVRLNEEKSKYLEERARQIEEKQMQVKEREIRVQQREDRVFDKEDRIQEREDRVMNKENQIVQAGKDAVKQDEQNKLEKAHTIKLQNELKQQQLELQQQLNFPKQNESSQQLQQALPQAQWSLAQESNQDNLNAAPNNSSFQNRSKQSHPTTPNQRGTELVNQKSYEQEQQLYSQQQKQFLSPPVRLRGSFHSEKPQPSDLSPLQKELSVNSEAPPLHPLRNLHPSDRQFSEQSHRESIASEQLPGYQQLQQRQYQTDSTFFPLGMNAKKTSQKSSQKLNIDKIHSEIQMLKQSLLSTDLLLRQSKSINHQERLQPPTAAAGVGGGRSSNRSSTPQQSLTNAKDNSSCNSSNPSNNKNLITTGEDRFLSEASKDSDSQVLNNHNNTVLRDNKSQKPRMNGEAPGGMQNTRRITSCKTEVDQSAFFSVNQSDYTKPIFSLDKSRHSLRQNQIGFPQRDISKTTNQSSPSLLHPNLATETHVLLRATQRERHPHDGQPKLRDDQVRREVSARARLSEHSASEIQILQSRSNSINQTSNSSNINNNNSSNNILARNPNSYLKINSSQTGSSKTGGGGGYKTNIQHNNYFPLQQQHNYTNNYQTSRLPYQQNFQITHPNHQQGYLENVPSYQATENHKDINENIITNEQSNTIKGAIITSGSESNINNSKQPTQPLQRESHKLPLEHRSVPVSSESSQNNSYILNSQGANKVPSSNLIIKHSNNSNNIQNQFFSNNSSSSNQQFYSQGNGNVHGAMPKYIAEIEESTKWKQSKSGSSFVSLFHSNNNSNQIYSQIPAAHVESANSNMYQAQPAHFHPFLGSAGISKKDFYNSNNNSNNELKPNMQISPPTFNPQDIQKQQQLTMQKQQFQHDKLMQEQQQMYPTMNSLKAQFNPANQNHFVSGTPLVNGDHAISHPSKEQESLKQQQQYLSGQQDHQRRLLPASSCSSSSSECVPVPASNQYLQNNLYSNIGYQLPNQTSQQYVSNNSRSIKDPMIVYPKGFQAGERRQYSHEAKAEDASQSQFVPQKAHTQPQQQRMELDSFKNKKIGS